MEPKTRHDRIRGQWNHVASGGAAGSDRAAWATAGAQPFIQRGHTDVWRLDAEMRQAVIDSDAPYWQSGSSYLAPAQALAALAR